MDASTTENTPGARSKPSGVRGFLRETAIIVVSALVVSSLLRFLLVQIYLIPTGSMEMTLQIDDRVAARKVGGFARGDIVVFRDTQGWMEGTVRAPNAVYEALVFLGLAPDTSHKHLIKRVVGVEGDHVTCCDTEGRVMVNGTSLDESEYLYTEDESNPDAGRLAFDVVVPEGRVFVLGDHRDNSRDSRCHLADDAAGESAGSRGFVAVDDVVGVAIAVVYPLDRIRLLPSAATFADLPSGGLPPSDPVTVGPDPVC